MAESLQETLKGAGQEAGSWRGGRVPCERALHPSAIHLQQSKYSLYFLHLSGEGNGGFTCRVPCRLLSRYVQGSWYLSLFWNKKVIKLIKKIIKLIYIFYQYFAGGYQFLGGGETPLRSAGQAIVWQNKYWQQNCKSWWNSTEGKSSAPCHRVFCGYSKTKAKSRCKRNVTS